MPKLFFYVTFIRHWLFLLVLTLTALLWLWSSSQPAAQWQTAIVERDTVEATVVAVGTLQPVRSVEVGAQVSGQITHILVQSGDVVSKGQLLAEIDASVLTATVDAGRAQIAGLRAQLMDAQAQHELAQLQNTRQQQMAKSESTRLEDVQVATATFKSTGARVAQIEAQILQTISSLKADEARLGYTRIYAPIAGTVIGIDAKEGQTLNATYQTPTVLRIADLSQMTVWADVSEADIRRVKAGMPAYFSTLGVERRRWHGKVRQVLPAPPLAAGSQGNGDVPAAVTKAVQYTVLFDVSNDDGNLMPQMTAQVTFVTSSVQDVLVAPLSAFKLEREEREAYLAQVLVGKGSQQQVQVRRVSLGTRDRMRTEVLEGLAEGEQVITGEIIPEAVIRRFQW